MPSKILGEGRVDVYKNLVALKPLSTSNYTPHPNPLNFLVLDVPYADGRGLKLTKKELQSKEQEIRRQTNR